MKVHQVLASLYLLFALLIVILVTPLAAQPRLIACSASRGDVYEVLNYAPAPSMSVLVDHPTRNFEDIAGGNANDPVYGFDNGTGTQQLYLINLAGGTDSPIGVPQPPGTLSGLDLGCDGILYASGADEKIYTVDRTTGQATEIFTATGWGAIADIAYASTDVGVVLYAAAEGAPSGGDQLLRIYLSTSPPGVALIGTNTLPEDTGGLDCNATLEMWGITHDGLLFEVDPGSGVATTPVLIQDQGPGGPRGANGLTFIDACKTVSVKATHWGELKVRYR